MYKIDSACLQVGNNLSKYNIVFSKNILTLFYSFLGCTVIMLDLSMKCTFSYFNNKLF